MDNEKKMKKAKYYLISGTATILLGLVLLMMVSGQKDTWDYYLSSSHRDAVDMGSLWSWILVLWGGLELGIGAILYADKSSSGSDQQGPQQPVQEAQHIDWIEGEIIEKEWDPRHHEVEWITMRQKNGLAVRLWHYISDDKAYKIGDSGLVRAQDRLITEFISSENVM